MLDQPETGLRTKAAVVEAFRHDTIIAAAIRVIARKGAEGMRVQDVANEAGVSKGTIYLYFRGREALRATAEKQTMETLLREVASIAEAGPTLQDILTDVVRRALERLDARDDVILAALELARVPRFGFASWRARAATLLPVHDPAASVPLILDCVRGLLERRLRQVPADDRDEVASSTVSMLLYGIAKKKDEPR